MREPRCVDRATRSDASPTDECDGAAHRSRARPPITTRDPRGRRGNPRAVMHERPCVHRDVWVAVRRPRCVDRDAAVGRRGRGRGYARPVRRRWPPGLACRRDRPRPTSIGAHADDRPRSSVHTEARGVRPPARPPADRAVPSGRRPRCGDRDAVRGVGTRGPCADNGHRASRAGGIDHAPRRSAHTRTIGPGRRFTPKPVACGHRPARPPIAPSPAVVARDVGTATRSGAWVRAARAQTTATGPRVPEGSTTAHVDRRERGRSADVVDPARCP